jgi:hypothetical protein
MENTKKIIGVSLDTIRNLFAQFDKTYRKSFIHNPSLMEVSDDLHYSDRELTEEEIDAIEARQNELITYPINTYDLSNHYRFDTQENFKLFLYQDYALEIFGNAQQTPGYMDRFNLISSFGLKNKLYDTVLLSKESDFSAQATYHFLAKTACRARNVKFVLDETDYFNHCDILITTSPIALQHKDKMSDKISIKVATEYNEYDTADHVVQSFTEINPQFISDIISNKIQISNLLSDNKK